MARYKGLSLIEPRSNSKTREFFSPVLLPPNLPGLACVVERVESLPPDLPVPLSKGGNFMLWREKCAGRAEVTETTQDGWPAVMVANGVHSLAGWPDDAALGRLPAQLCAEAGLETEVLPEGLRCRISGGKVFWFNYNPEPTSDAGRTLPPARVLWENLLT